MIEEKDQIGKEIEEKDNNRKEIEEKDNSRKEIEEKDKSREEELKEDSVELLLEEQSRNQVRSDYRRSLGNEYRRRYME
jgi:hypothetical protein